MASPSKENLFLELFLENSPLKEWHFNEIVKETSLSRDVANKWMKKYTKNGLLKKHKVQGRFPFYSVGERNSVYYSSKRIYALEQLYKTGLIAELLSQKEAKTIIIFGSMIKGDWYKDSDVDIFILGNLSSFNKKAFETRLNKHIELHIFNQDEIKNVKTGLIDNIINGYLVKGKIQDVLNEKRN
jgi:predicted nucleotidyltransferase